jgi:hypothetical protein
MKPIQVVLGIAAFLLTMGFVRKVQAAEMYSHLTQSSSQDSPGHTSRANDVIQDKNRNRKCTSLVMV